MSNALQYYSARALYRDGGAAGADDGDAEKAHVQWRQAWLKLSSPLFFQWLIWSILVTHSNWYPIFMVETLFWSGLEVYDVFSYQCSCYRINIIMFQ